MAAPAAQQVLLAVHRGNGQALAVVAQALVDPGTGLGIAAQPVQAHRGHAAGVTRGLVAQALAHAHQSAQRQLPLFVAQRTHHGLR